MSRLEEALAEGRFVVTGELPAIDGGGLAAVRSRLEPIAPWVDAVNATDNTAAHAHASPVAVAIAMRQLGVEPVLQLVCRDRNRLALQSDVVGAALHGIENICCLTGDDITAGDEPEARRVFDLDGIQLVSVVKQIGAGRYLSGRAIEPAPHLFVGAVENPTAPPFDYRVDRALKKARAGARFLQLQICFRPELLAGFVAEAVARGLVQQAALLPSICVVGSAKALRFMDEKVPGISVPAAVIERVERAADQGEACFELACELAEQARSLTGVAGLHLISFRRDAAVERLCTRLGIPPRTERESSGHGPPVAV
jgi:methylenetetrahydrofolate reductase (NADPH)